MFIFFSVWFLNKTKSDNCNYCPQCLVARISWCFKNSFCYRPFIHWRNFWNFRLNLCQYYLCICPQNYIFGLHTRGVTVPRWKYYLIKKQFWQCILLVPNIMLDEYSWWHKPDEEHINMAMARRNILFWQSDVRGLSALLFKSYLSLNVSTMHVLLIMFRL